MDVSFKGVCPPHKIGKVYIYPISKDLSLSTISKYCDAINPANKLGSGCNGEVFTLGMDLVIKKAKPNALVNKSLMNEAKKLDILYNLEKEKGIKLKNIQSGIAGFEFPNGDSYLVSTLVKGSKANIEKNPFNEKNLDSLMNLLTELDKGSDKDGRLMMFDLNLNNINITENQAGIFDFEYMIGQNLEQAIKDRIIGKLGSASSHVSDTSNLQSNVRSFEYAGLYYYFREMPENNVKDLLTKYLKIKSKYHKKMCEYYNNLSTQSNYPKELSKIASSEQSHSKLLAKPDNDIIKSEAMKIQMANFVFVSGQWCKTSSITFNTEQVMTYQQEGLRFFKKQLEKARQNCDKDRTIYYQNCINLFDGWKRVLTLPEIMNEGQRARITKDKIKTLDEILL